jgi:hypothetical protein
MIDAVRDTLEALDKIYADWQANQCDSRTFTQFAAPRILDAIKETARATLDYAGPISSDTGEMCVTNGVTFGVLKLADWADTGTSG